MDQDQTDIDAIAELGQSNSPKWSRYIGGATLLAAIGFGWLWLGTGSEPAIKYQTQVAEKMSFVILVSATGTVEPTNLVEISSELSGTIRAVHADYNSRVTKGEKLAELDTQKLEAAVEHSQALISAKRAQLAQAQINLDESQRDADRMAELRSRGVTTEQGVLAAQSTLARANASMALAQADIRIAQADLDLNQATLEKACICAPIDGIVLERNVDVGQIVASSLQAPVLFTIAEDLKVMELRADVDEADIGKVEIGNRATFTVEAFQNRDFPARIASLRYAPEIVDGVVTYKAILSIDNSELLLRPGMTATANIVVAELDDVLAVPNSALRYLPSANVTTSAEGGESGTGLLGMLFSRPEERPQEAPQTRSSQRTLWLLVDGQPQPVVVEMGQTNGSVTEIKSGDLNPGDAIIVEENQ